MKLLLIHGQGRTPLSMLLLGWRLNRHGYSTHYFGYLAGLQTFDQIVDRFVQTVRQKIRAEPYVIIGHSLGNIIARASLPRLTDNPPQHLIMLAPPNQPPKMARIFQSNPAYRLVTGDAGKKLADKAFYKRLPRSACPTTIIAGTYGLPESLSPFAGEPNDMILTVRETQLAEGKEPILVPAAHPLIMNSRQVTRIILDQLSQVG